MILVRVAPRIRRVLMAAEHSHQVLRGRLAAALASRWSSTQPPPFSRTRPSTTPAEPRSRTSGSLASFFTHSEREMRREAGLEM